MNNRTLSSTLVYLDVGCGHGFQVSCFPKSTVNIGIDSNYENIKISISRYPKSIFCVMDAHHLAFQKESVSRIYIHDVLEHINYPDVAINEIYDTLLFNGTCSIKVPTPNTEEILTKIRRSYFSEIGHVRIYSKSQLITLVTNNNFTIQLYQLCDVLSFVELAVNFLFARHLHPSSHQVNVFNWRDNVWMFIWHIFLLHFNPDVQHTPLRYSPVLPFTLILGALIETFFRKYFSKSQHLVVEKTL